MRAGTAHVVGLLWRRSKGIVEMPAAAAAQSQECGEAKARYDELALGGRWL